MVFFHIPRTGGSSIWHSLAEVASAHALPIADLYHHARYHYHDNTDLYRTFIDTQTFLRKHDCLIHHHLPRCIAPYFDQPIIYTTIVRDPVDRFISELNHGQNLLRGDLDIIQKEGLITPTAELRGIGWSDDLITLALNPAHNLEKLIQAASKLPYFQHYYRLWFSRLLYPKYSNQAPEQAHTTDIPQNELVAAIRASFIHIGIFPDVANTARAIGRHFQFDQMLIQNKWIHRTNSQSLALEMRTEIRTHFAKDYSLLAELGVIFKP